MRRYHLIHYPPIPKGDNNRPSGPAAADDT